ncbi:MAG: hypothetical protein NTW85_10255 [Methylococcales bacterium]|jgi:hypothetical protein|nr:hypothetical protein [Methylococcales bacterium]
MNQLEVLEHQIAELDDDAFTQLRDWFAEFEKTRLQDNYWAEQAEQALKTGFAGCEETARRLQERLNAET